MNATTKAWVCLTPIILLMGGCMIEDTMFDPAAGRAITAFPSIFEPLADPAKVYTPPRKPEIIEYGENLATLIYTCRHSSVEELRTTIEAFTSIEASIQTCRSRNAIVISDTKPAIKRLLGMLEALDRPMPQLLVEARVVEMTLNKEFEFEIQHIFNTLAEAAGGTVRSAEITLGPTNAPGMGLRLAMRPWKMNTRQFDTFLRLLVTRSNARILISPNLTVSNGESGNIVTGEEVPVQSVTESSSGNISTSTSFKSIGIKFQIQPQWITDDSAKIGISIEVSTVTGYADAGNSGISIPIVSIRRINSTLSVKDGEVLTIGGLLRNEDRDVIRKTPVIGDIPGLGMLFRSENKESVQTQLIFFLRVHILPEGRVNVVRLHKPGSDFFSGANTTPTTRPTTRPTKGRD